MTTKPNIWIFSGAGLSAPSGIPTFGGKDGIWENHKIEEVCDMNTFKQNRKKIFEFYNTLQNKYKNAKPNSAHKFIAELQKRYGKERVNVMTQNIDNLLEKAGCEGVIHLHGEVGYLQCTICSNIWESDLDVEKRCSNPKCNSRWVKPYVIFYNEKNDQNYSNIKKWVKQLKESDIFIITGTRGQVVNWTNFTQYYGNRKSVKYWKSNYFLNVYDEIQYHQIPEDVDNYIVGCCTEFFPKIDEKIKKIMESDTMNKVSNIAEKAVKENQHEMILNDKLDKLIDAMKSIKFE